jgi:uncharacterized protein
VPCLHPRLSVQSLFLGVLARKRECAALRTYQHFSYRDAGFRIACDRFDTAIAEIVRQREILETYIRIQPEFLVSLSPVTPLPEAPEVARRMAAAARSAGVGPMAAVAGAMAQLATEAALADGAKEAIIDNGGDLFMALDEPATLALYTGGAKIGSDLAFTVLPEETPLSICSSSGRMGHSLSLGDCDLATVVARSGALADAAATRAGNLVRSVPDIEPALNQIMAIPGIQGVLLVKEDRIGLAGRLPKLIKNPAPLHPRQVGQVKLMVAE